MAQVLVVDDSATVRRVVKRTLEHAGHGVRMAGDGQSGLEQALAERPDLVLVDFIMPRMNGLYFCRALRRFSQLRTIPVVLMSAKASRISTGFLAQTGAVDAIEKPFGPEALLATAHRAMLTASSEARSSEACASKACASEARSLEASTVGMAPLGEGASSRAGRAEPQRGAKERGAPVDAMAERIASFVCFAKAQAASQAGAQPDPRRLARQLVRACDERAFLALSDDLQRLLPTPTPSRSLSGRLDAFGVGDVLQLLAQQQQTGSLRLGRAGRADRDERIHIQLRKGRISQAEGWFRERPELAADAYASRAPARASPRRRADHPVGGTEAEPAGGLAYTVALVYEALRWSQGRFAFYPCATYRLPASAHLDLAVDPLLAEGLRRVDEWRLIAPCIPHLRVVPRRGNNPEPLKLPDPERAVLDAIDGERDVIALVAHTEIEPFEVCRALYRLAARRAVTIAEPAG